MIQFPNCKINLGLNVVARRDDGFHDIETVFYPVPLNDALEIIQAPDGIAEFQTSGLDIPGQADQNLCLKALHLLEKDFDLPAVKMHLHKAIPMGSGLGGGSADGAFALKMLNELFVLGLDNEKLKHYARHLGSDCAFFIDNHPVFAHGRGDQMENAALDLSGLFLAIVVPAIHVSTADAYRMVVPHMPLNSVKEIIRLPLDDWNHMLLNDFETPVAARFPVISEIRQAMYDAGAVYSSMSGSGSAVYGIFEEMPSLVSFSHHFAWSTKL